MENKIELKQKHIDLLSSLPEQGMGYQIIDVILKNGQILSRRIVFNSTFLKLNKSEQINIEDIEKIEIHKNTTDNNKNNSLTNPS